MPDGGATHDEGLLALVRKVAGEARPLEQVEAYAARSKGTEIKVFGGEVESLSSADVDGVGVRVVVDGRQGFAWAGSLEPDIVAETLTEAYLIENGRLTAPVRAANLIGNGPETLLAIDAVGTDFDTWAGTCGKDGQGVPVSAGQPTVRVSEMTVGGTAGA